MTQYAEIDESILKAVAARRHPLYACGREAAPIAAATGREAYRVIDGRLQALRRAGKIVHLTKAQSNGSAGWYLSK